MRDKPAAVLAYSMRSDAPTAGCLTQNPYSTLCVPTQLTRIGEDYFLVDDTENHRVLIYEKTSDGFALTQYFENIGVRPHNVECHEDTERFYMLGSNSGEVYVFYQEEGTTNVCLEKIMTIPGMENTYIRSFTIDGNQIYFTASNGVILLCRLKDLSVISQWSTPPEIAGLVQIQKIQDYYYLTVSTDITGDGDKATIVRTRDLSGLPDYEYETISKYFEADGTPYYISAFDGHYYMTQHCDMPGHGAWQFDIIENELTNVSVLYP